MWLLNAATYELQAFEGSNIPKYAILSHRWEDGEVSFKEMRKGRYREMKGFYKIEACCRQAIEDGLSHAWVDTCCIDKRSSAELSEAINSMYAWYQRAAVCYAYLSDISLVPQRPIVDSGGRYFTTSVWFTRGWTLQELLAPSKLIFYDSTWNWIGSRSDQCLRIHERTGISTGALIQFSPEDYCIAERMSWAANRVTTRVEDRAYSLLGIFDVNMPLLYGEGDRAFRRLQESIMAASDDFSIFAWSHDPDPGFSMLANSPDSFEGGYLFLHKQKNAAMYSEFGGFSQDAFTFYPRRPKFTVSKHGIAGDLHLCQYVFNIHLISLGIFLKNPDQVTAVKDGISIYMFVEFDSSKNEYRRVTLDNRSCAVASANSSTLLHKVRQCDIVKQPIYHTSSSEFDRSQLMRFQFEGNMNVLGDGVPMFIAAGVLDRECLYSPELPFERVRFSMPKAESKDKVRLCICLWYLTGDTLELTPSVIIHVAFNHSQRPVLIFTTPTRENHSKDLSLPCRHKDAKGHFRCPTGCITLRTQRIRSSKKELGIHPPPRLGLRMQPALQGWTRDPYKDIDVTQSIKMANLGVASVYDQTRNVSVLFRFSSYIPGVEMLPFEWAVYPARSSESENPGAESLYRYWYGEELGPSS